MNEAYSTTFNYILQIEDRDCWLAATPELLVRRNSDCVSSMALAGTKPADGDSEWTTKEYHEQEVVTQQIQANYADSGYQEIQTDGPNTIRSGYVEHLQTLISARDTDNENFNLLLEKLHPTPAVCGYPTDDAKKIISQAEQHERELYTGYIGITTEENEQYFVNLRCMKLRTQSALLYLGGGITKGSEMESEWQETENKARTLTSLIEKSKL